MAAIDWLLNWNPKSERMHQVVLSGLLRRTRLLKLLGVPAEPTDLQEETHRRLYDFTISLASGVKLNIELKVDASLEEEQILRQMKALGDNDFLLYILLGTTRFQRRESDLQVLRERVERPSDPKHLLCVDLDRALREVSVLASGGIDDPDQRDLAVAYSSLLRRIHTFTEGFEGKPCDQWGPDDWHGFYAELNKRFQLDGRHGHVYNKTGGFEGFWWDWKALPLSPGAEGYLQLDQDRLCFRVYVLNREDRARVRNQFSEAVLAVAGQTKIAVERPDRFGNGKTMAAAIATGDYRGTNPAATVDWGLCEHTIRQATEVLEAAVARCEAE